MSTARARTPVEQEELEWRKDRARVAARAQAIMDRCDCTRQAANAVAGEGRRAFILTPEPGGWIVHEVTPEGRHLRAELSRKWARRKLRRALRELYPTAVLSGADT